MTFVEAARSLAATLLQSPESTPAERIDLGYQRVVGRLPSDNERKVLLAGLAEDLARFKAEPKSAEQLVRVGDSPVPDKVAKEELAAYTLLANVLLNLDEFITQE